MRQAKTPAQTRPRPSVCKLATACICLLSDVFSVATLGGKAVSSCGQFGNPKMPIFRCCLPVARSHARKFCAVGFRRMRRGRWNVALSQGASATPGTATNCASTATTGNVLDLKYSFNLGSGDNGNVVAITNNRDNTRSESFTYDSLNRLATAATQTTGVTIPNANCWGLTFGYDAWGNLLQSSTTGPSGCGEPLPLNVTVTTANQISAYCYDAAGNLVLNAACPVGSFTPTYSYNAENQLTSTAGVTYTYDGDGKRVMKSNGTIYWYGINSDPLEETDLTGNTNNPSFLEEMPKRSSPCRFRICRRIRYGDMRPAMKGTTQPCSRLSAYLFLA